MENDSNVEECSDYQKMPISWELPSNFFVSATDTCTQKNLKSE